EQLTLTLPGEGVEHTAARKLLFAKAHAARARLDDLGEIDVETVAPASTDWPAMDYLERHLFRSAREMSPLDDVAAQTINRFHVIAASSQQTEVEELARRVKRLLLEGTAPDDVVVSFRSTGAYSDRLRSVFSDCGIPFALDAMNRLTSTPLVRSLLELLRLQANDWPYRDLLAVVGDGAWGWWDLPCGGLLGNVPIRGAVEYHVRLAQTPGGRDAVRRSIRTTLEQEETQAEKREGQSHRSSAALARARIASGRIEELAQTLAELPDRASIEEWLAAIEKLLAKLYVAGWRDEGDANDRSSELANRAAWETWRKGLLGVAQLERRLRRSVEGGQWDLRGFIELAAETAGQLRAPQEGGWEGCVRILGAEAARNLRPRHLFLAGLDERSFPAGTRSSETSAEVGANDDGDAGIAASEAPSADRHQDEMLLFYELATSPSVSLTLSYPALDAKAQPLPPSPYLTEIERCFAGAGLPRTELSLGVAAGDQGDDVPASRTDWRRAAVRQALAGRRQGLAQLASVAVDQGGVPGALDALAAVAWRGQWEGFDVHEGMLLSRTVQLALQRRFGAEHLWSPSQLETYASCPFRFFGEHLLRLEEPPDLRLASDFRRRGSLLHEALAQFHQQASADAEADPFGDEAAPGDDDRSVSLFVDRFRTRVSEVYAAGAVDGVDGALREIERLQILSWAESLAQQHQAYAQLWKDLDVPPTPVHLEVRFGPTRRDAADETEGACSTDEPYTLELGGGQSIKLVGRIDRIDVGRVGDQTVFNVIDYKTSKQAKVDASAIAAGKQLQLPLYALAAAQLLLAAERAAPLAAGFWAVQGDGFNTVGRKNQKSPALEMAVVSEGKLTPRAEWDQMQGQIARRVTSMVHDIRQGRFPVFNDDEHCGRYCHLKTVCRINQVRSLGKTWEPL
ncbi:MAG: PD-(D/E)XK nuclease family protein, partial [Planctomycetales bacterium]|nr:PD-(D/E)XK nuclease family protein [Planctomycetales bacterium]